MLSHLDQGSSGLLPAYVLAALGLWLGFNRLPTLLAPSASQRPSPPPDASALTHAGLPIPAPDETKHFKLLGTTGTGKSTAIREPLARLRKFGGRCILGLQSIAQVRGLYGDAEAQTIVENCGNTLILRCSASECGGTAEFASRLIGRREIVLQVHSRTRPLRLGGLLHQSETVSPHYVTEDAVIASEIEQLPDLAGFLKFASQPARQRVQVSHNA